PVTWQETARIPTGKEPHHLYLTPDEKSLVVANALGDTLTLGPTPIFVLNSLDANISIVDPVTWQETARIPTGKEPHHLYLTPDEKSLVVANA
ncbi:YncE family protein, partial [Escherichia coli]|uniref:YncE family protein n=1 Tax=Escherichia coli TaxID=562 RepID=UPI003F50BA4A